MSVDVTQRALTDDVDYNLWLFTVQDSDGFIYDRGITGDAEPSFGYGKLDKDQQVRGWLSFEVPASATLVSIIHERRRKVVIADLTQ